MNTKTTSAISMLLWVALAQSAAAQCRVTELETQLGWVPVARGLTPKGLVVGALEADDLLASRPAQWSSDGRLTLLSQDPRYAAGRVLDANDAGDLVGTRGVDTSLPDQAVRWKPQGAVPLSVAPSSVARAVNRRGVAVGHLILADGMTYQATRWGVDGTATALPGLGGTTTFVTDVDRYGRMVGTATELPSNYRAVSWAANGELRVLPTLGGQHSFASGSNDSGDVVGRASLNQPQLEMRPVLWRKGAEAIDLGSFGGTDGLANAVNNQQVVVGFSSDATRKLKAFVWRSGSMTDLNTMVPKRFLNAGNRLESANRISDQGVILAWAVQSVSGQPDRGRSVILKRCLN